MKWTFDWKYLLGTFIAIVPLVFSFYQWRSDQQGHDISLRLISSSSLQPLAKSEIYDVRMTVNGSELVNPHFSIIELTNIGSKPILSADFDTPIEFTGKDGLAFITARVDLTDPKDMPVKMTVDAQRISIAPFLFNPGDRVLVSTITSGPDPFISVKARIAGIRNLAIDSSIDSGNKFKAAFDLGTGSLSLVIYFTYPWILSRRRALDRRFLIASALCCGVAGSLSIKVGLDELEVIFAGIKEYRMWINGALMIGGILAGYRVGQILRRRPSHPANQP
ncbi:hypothetical protein V476_12595 [Pseudomonas syringae KCTC 12500]|uniref:hypothetical protein n=1 Tax=Pseudomonas syringae TaxID=317 RepID=UPI000468B718|nr:hypothetical protein [Pseudomonas syringae]KMY01932.1 hypothetical protein V476_12595 [Pseudomonas syringae KCTC 12500]POR83866.1 hypothetical protein BKM21_20685 [Pseudomonas syringae pv. syringae]